MRLPVRALAATAVRPNHLTTARLLTGLVSAGCFATGDSVWVLAGAGVLVVSIFLDRADGELARVQQSSTPWGHTYDIVTDAAVNAAVMIGIGFAAAGGVLGSWAPLAGLIAGLSVAYVLVVMVRFEQNQGTGSAKFSAAGGFDADDAMLAIPLAMALGWYDLILLFAAVGAPAAAIVVTVFLRRQQRDFV